MTRGGFGRLPTPLTSDDDGRNERISASEYMEKHNVAFYLRDVVSLLLRARDERPLEFIADYFTEVLNGTHVLLREFSYVNRCARDRWAFVQSAREALADLDQDQLVSAVAMTQLLRLVCSDFPLEVAEEACRLCGSSQGMHALGRLLHAACVRICFADFLRRASEVFRSCDRMHSGVVACAVFGHALRQACLALPSSAEYSTPPAGLFDELIGTRGEYDSAEILQLIVHSRCVCEVTVR